MKQEYLLNQNLQFIIEKGIEEGSICELRNVTEPLTKEKYTVKGKIKYEQDGYWWREGNNLRGHFIYRRSDKGSIFIPPYPIEGMIDEQLELQEMERVYSGKGFYDKMNQTTGDYIITVEFV